MLQSPALTFSKWKYAQDALAATELRPTDRIVLCRLCMYADGRGLAWPSRSELARACGAAPGSITNSLKRLREAGYIESQHVEGNNNAWRHRIMLKWDDVGEQRTPSRPMSIR